MTVKANKLKIKNVDYEINAATLNDHEDSYFATAADVGDLTDLDTTDTSSIVDAINELVGDVGTLSSLTTTAQNSLVAAVNEVDDHADTNANAIEILADDIADVYSSSSTYKVGQLCIRENTLYRCTTAITTAEEWTPAHWTATTIAEEIENRILWFPSTAVSATTGTIVTINDSRITTDHVLARAEFASSSSITALTAWSTDTAGAFTITGTCASATTVDITLVKKNN